MNKGIIKLENKISSTLIDLHFLRDSLLEQKSKFCYYVWEKKLSFDYNILLTFSNLYSINITFPVEIIHLILNILLTLEQSILTNNNGKCPCDEKICIKKWWSVYPIELAYPENPEKIFFELKVRAPLHCDDCHKIVYTSHKSEDIYRYTYDLQAEYKRLIFKCKVHGCNKRICKSCRNNLSNYVQRMNPFAFKCNICRSCTITGKGFELKDEEKEAIPKRTKI